MLMVAVAIFENLDSPDHVILIQMMENSLRDHDFEVADFQQLIMTYFSSF